MGISAKTTYILNAVAGSGTGPELRCPDIDSIGTVVDSRDATR